MSEKKGGLQYVDSPEIRLSGIRKIVMAGDPGCTRFSDESKQVLGQILAQKTDLFFMLGDLTFTGLDEEFRDLIRFFDARVRVPVFAVRGNHDLAGYTRFLGRLSYALLLDKIVCFFLCNATGHFSKEDLGLLKQSLETHGDKDFLVLMHIPPPVSGNRKFLKDEDWNELKTVLEPHRGRIRHIFCGHVHGFYEFEADGYPVTVTAGGGAAMIHELPESAKRIYHSVTLFLDPGGSLRTEVVPVEGVPVF
ncbi:MAG TPA: metallophosphoesterase [Candidatus Omnitrophota bacterium]|nr:metallophosphoesterase [Candidatus Omnitrophota bacterium]HPS37025.1 metallophosphoesterase [Candidatus Omnitrophota bacterium]